MGDSLAKAGPLASDLIAYYASLLISGNTIFKNFPSSIPAGMNPTIVQDSLVLLALQAGKTPVQIASLNLGLDTSSIRTIAAVLVQSNLLKTIDTLDWFHPVRVSTAVSIASTLSAGGGAVNVNGAFSWNAGASVTLSRITVLTPNPGDSSTVQLSYQFNAGKPDTLWSLSGNLTLQAKTSASVGWDTLLVVLSTDSAHSVAARVPFQVVAKDFTPPTLSVLSPAHDTATVPNTTSSFVVQALATDSGSGVDSLKIGTKTFRTAAAIADTLWDTLPLVVGANVATVQAWDHAGNTSSATVTITRALAPVNTKAPTVIHVSPQQDTETVPWSTKSATLSWTITGDTTITAVTLNGHPIAGSTASARLYQTSMPLIVGMNLFPLAAVDAYGLSAYDTLRITRQGDTSHPVVARGAGTDDTVLLKSQSTYSPVWTVADNALDSVTINGVAATAGSGNTFSAPVPLSGDSLWITLVAKDSSGNTTRDSIKVRRLALVNISGAGTSYSAGRTPMATLSSNLPGARFGYSSDKIQWTPYPIGGITISHNEILYAEDTVGSAVSGIDSATFLYSPTFSQPSSPCTGNLILSITAPGGTIEDSMSTGTSWTVFPGPTSVTSSVTIFARSRIGASVSDVVSATFAFPPVLSPSSKSDTESIVVNVSGIGADSLRISRDSLTWNQINSAAITLTSSGKLYAQLWIRGILSSTSVGTYKVFPKGPGILPIPGGYAPTQYIDLTSSTGATIQYTQDGGTTWKNHSTGNLVAITATGDLPVRLVKPGMDTTALSAHYVIHNEIPWTYTSYGSFRDPRDGQTYRTTQIGGQTWMANNFNYSGTGSSPIGTSISDTVDFTGKYGRLYTWTEALGLPIADTAVLLISSDTTEQSDWSHNPREGICPVGWHVPSGADMFDTLINTVVTQAGKSCNDLLATMGQSIVSGNYGDVVTLTDYFGMRVIVSPFWFSSESANNMADAVSIGIDWCRWNQYNSKSSTASIRCIKN